MRDHFNFILMKMPRNLTESKEGEISIVWELNLIEIEVDFQVMLVRRRDLYLLMTALVKS